MELSTRETFKVIGRCSKMQTVSLDQETKLWDGIPYDINFFQDFSKLNLEGVQISSIPVSALIGAIPLLSGEVAERSAANYQSGEDYRRNTELWESVAKYEKDAHKKEKKWQKKHPKPKSQKETLQNFQRIVKDIMRE